MSKYQTSFAKSFQAQSPKITIGEMRELIAENDISPSKIFSKEDFLNDSKLMEAMNDKIDLEAYRAKETKEKEKKKEEEDDDFLIPGSGTLDKPGEEDDLIPD